jgi:hypothetical protein
VSRPSESSLPYRVAFAVGLSLRKTIDVLLVPYRLLAGEDRPTDRLLPAGRTPRRLPPRPPRPKRATRRPVEAARAAAGEGLGQLSRALMDPDPAVRALALETVADLDTERAAQMVIDTLHDPDPDVRCAAAAAAARGRISPAVFSLILALDDDEIEVRDEAHRAIERITGQEVGFEPADAPETRRRRIEELKQWWKELRFAQLALGFKEETP